MSRTIRRNKFNKKKRFFHHYWEAYSHKEVKGQDYLPEWKYHSDNYYTKVNKRKQILKAQTFNQIEQEFKSKAHHLKGLNVSDDKFDIVMEHHHFYDIKWDLY